MRAGATWRYTMHGPNGADYANESVFVEVVRPERIVIDRLEAEVAHLTEPGAAGRPWRRATIPGR